MSRQSALQSTLHLEGPLGPHRMSGSPLYSFPSFPMKGLMHSQCGVVGGSVVGGSVVGGSVALP